MGGVLCVEGVNLEFCEYGERSEKSPTLVMLHEGLGSVAMWKSFPQQLQEKTGLHLFVYSRQSYGQSDPLPQARKPDYMLAEAEVLNKALKTSDISQAILLGHSDGASIALLSAAHSRSFYISGLILMAPHVFCENISIESIQVAKQNFENGELRAGLEPYHKDVDNAFWRWNDIWLDEQFREWNIENCLDQISIPVLCIQGMNDEYGSEAQLEAISAACSGSVTIRLMENCRHAPHRDQNQATLETIGEFISTLH